MPTHVDRVFADPLTCAPEKLLARFSSAEDPAIGEQERSGWATYVYISKPHTMNECPYAEHPRS